MLKKNPINRFTADQALDHDWLKNKEEEVNVEEHVLSGALENFKKFNAEEKLQQAAVSFIVNQLATKEDLAELEQTFKKLDTNKDGKLSREELLAGYSQIRGDTAEAEVDKIFELADTDGSGVIEYSEWMVASMNKSTMLDEDKLWKAFKLFDVENNDQIKASELRKVLGGGKAVHKKIWDDLIAEGDINKDGVIRFDEFKTLMMKMFDKS